MTAFRTPLRVLAEGETADTAAPSGDVYGTVNAIALKIGGSTVGSTAAEIDNVADLSARPVAGGSALTLTAAAHAGKTILLDTAAGTTITLPAASGTQAVYRFAVTVLATSNSHIIKVANASDIMVGAILTIDTDTSDAAASFATAATSDTITLNRSTTGSVRTGEFIEVIDAATNRFHVRGTVCVTGTPATPFSATV